MSDVLVVLDDVRVVDVIESVVVVVGVVDGVVVAVVVVVGVLVMVVVQSTCRSAMLNSTTCSATFFTSVSSLQSASTPLLLDGDGKSAEMSVDFGRSFSGWTPKSIQ